MVSAALHPPAPATNQRRKFVETEAGPIPADWKLLPAKDVGVFRGGNGFPLSFQGKNSGEYPFFKVSDMNNPGNERTLVSANNYLSHADRKRLGAYVFPASTIVFAKVGAAIFLERKRLLGQPSCLDNNMAGFQITDPSVDVSFIQYYLQNVRFGDLVSTTALPALSGTVLGSVKLPLPPTKQEQHAIAKALSDADALIEAMEHLIAKKRAIKQGTMQELLSGRRRLPGFSGEWQARRLGSLGAFLKGSGIRKDQAQSGDLPCVRYGEIYTDHDDVLRRFRSFISHEVAATATRIREGDILFAGSGETKEEIGKCVAIATSVAAYAGGDIVILRVTGHDPVFLGYALNLPEVQRQKASKGQGDAVVHISAAALASIEVTLPDPLEQSAIAKVVSEIDEELATLAERRAKARQIKQGMMQELLTGRVRLV